MKCDELKEIMLVNQVSGERAPSGTYKKAEVDAAIAELKGQVNGFKNRANLWLYNAQNEHNAAVAVRMENAKLKAKLAEKDKEIVRLKEKVSEERSAKVDYKISAYDLNDELIKTHKETKRNKYKRCLAMAMWCRSRACFYDTLRENNLYWGMKSDRAYKWHKRWLKIAEKFKEAK